MKRESTICPTCGMIGRCGKDGGVCPLRRLYKNTSKVVALDFGVNSDPNPDPDGPKPARNAAAPLSRRARNFRTADHGSETRTTIFLPKTNF